MHRKHSRYNDVSCVKHVKGVARKEEKPRNVQHVSQAQHGNESHTCARDVADGAWRMADGGRRHMWHAGCMSTYHDIHMLYASQVADKVFA